ncbi:MAG: SEC-C metal-binding domain-containing protein [Myxococcaceae bacterium]
MLDGPSAMEARLDIDSGLVEPDEDEGRVPLSGEWVDYVQSQVDGELLDLLHERWLRAKGWRPRKPQEAHPPARDAGKLLGWYETHPEDRRDLYLDGDSVFMADDLYCMNPACPCNEVTLDFAELVDDELTRSVGHLRLGLPDLNIVEWSSSGENRELVQRLWTAFRARHRQVADRLGKRKLSMTELGRLWFEAPAVKSKTTVGAERAGRNDPCPCGSGKKYKRCCAG